MKKIFFILFASVLFLSCQKENMLTDASSVEEQDLKAVQNTSNSNSSSTCYSDFLTNNYDALKQSNNIPIYQIATSFWTSSIASNYETLQNCGTVIFANDRNITDLEAVAPPSGPAPTPIYADPAAIMDYLHASYYFGNTSINYLDILKQALGYANSQSITYSSYAEKMMAIAKGIYELGYGNIYVSQAYHGSPDPLPAYVYHAIEILAGKYAMTSDFYNEYVASGATDYVSFPVVTFHKGIQLKLSDDYVQSEETGPFYEVSANVQIDASTSLMYYVTDLSTLMVEPGVISPAPNQTSVYYQSSTQEFFTNSSMTSFIPNGFYYLPSTHLDTFQKNNYMLEIKNGKVKTVLGI